MLVATLFPYCNNIFLFRQSICLLSQFARSTYCVDQIVRAVFLNYGIKEKNIKYLKKLKLSSILHVMTIIK